jgi:hypothetical protein
MGGDGKEMILDLDRVPGRRDRNVEVVAAARERDAGCIDVGELQRVDLTRSAAVLEDQVIAVARTIKVAIISSYEIAIIYIFLLNCSILMR